MHRPEGRFWPCLDKFVRQSSKTSSRSPFLTFEFGDKACEGRRGRPESGKIIVDFRATLDGCEAFPECVEGKTVGGEVRVMIAEGWPVLNLVPGKATMWNVNRFRGGLDRLGE